MRGWVVRLLSRRRPFIYLPNTRTHQPTRPGFVQSPIHEKVSDSRKKLSPEAAAAYPHLYTKARAAMKADCVRKASPTSATSSAILHALTSPTPKTRYPVANSGGVPAPIVLISAALFPDRLTDYLLTV